MTASTPPHERAGDERRCPVHVQGRPGAHDGLLQCEIQKGHKRPHRFMAPDATVGWWPLGSEPSAWDDLIFTPATDPRWPKESA